MAVLFADMVGFTTISERLGEEGTFALTNDRGLTVTATGKGLQDRCDEPLWRCCSRHWRYQSLHKNRTLQR
jgi:hypothetical protein